MPNFFLEDPLTVGTLVPFPKETAHHAQKVLRLKDKDSVNVWNGDGQYRSAQLVFEENKVAAQILSLLPKATNARIQVEILQALPEGDKMDWIIEKCCEVGVSGFWPVQAKRSVVKLNGDRLEKRQQHWQRVAISACSQSGQASLPTLQNTARLSDALESITEKYPNALLWWLSPHATQWTHEVFFQNIGMAAAAATASPGTTPASPPQVVIAIGPEGGWAPEEEHMALQAGFKPVKLATQVLRTETAALYVTAQIQAWDLLKGLR
ncbi:MAG: 16S rRNA (uracil(1498)-N(3))-methyltransferase [Burkholderiales bacterium]|nr:16S rRNA (uracil(1498)-N(3))-methyltransferase [Burkholderiales bacterium]